MPFSGAAAERRWEVCLRTWHFFPLSLAPACLWQLRERVGTLDSATGASSWRKKGRTQGYSTASSLPLAQHHKCIWNVFVLLWRLLFLQNRWCWDVGKRTSGSLLKGFWAVRVTQATARPRWELRGVTRTRCSLSGSRLGCLERKPFGWTLPGPYPSILALLLPFLGFK